MTEEEIEWTIREDLIHVDIGDRIAFGEELALAHLLINDVVFINSYYMEKGLPEDIKDKINIFVNCNDVLLIQVQM